MKIKFVYVHARPLLSNSSNPPLSNSSNPPLSNNSNPTLDNNSDPIMEINIKHRDESEDQNSRTGKNKKTEIIKETEELMILLSDLLRQRKKELEVLRQELMKKKKKYPAGTLRIHVCRGKAQYYHRIEPSDRTGKYLTADKKVIVQMLAQKDYDYKLNRAVDQEIRAIEGCLRKYPLFIPEKIYEKMSEERKKIIVPYYQTDEMFMIQWCDKEYEGLPFPEDYPELYTERGERVRSKSEVIIANLMAKEDVPYKYECPVSLKGFGTVYPDFTALNKRERKEYYWEHLGMMDDPEYSEKAVRKISAYIKNGIFPGEQLILTAETKDYPIDVREIKILIQHYLK